MQARTHPQPSIKKQIAHARVVALSSTRQWTSSPHTLSAHHEHGMPDTWPVGRKPAIYNVSADTPKCVFGKLLGCTAIHLLAQTAMPGCRNVLSWRHAHMAFANPDWLAG